MVRDPFADGVERRMSAHRATAVAIAVHDLNHEPVDVVGAVQETIAAAATQVPVEVRVQTMLERCAQRVSCRLTFGFLEEHR